MDHYVFPIPQFCMFKSLSTLQSIIRQMMQVQEQSSQMVNSKRCFDLTLYFREIEVKRVKKLTCVEIYQDNIYLGTSEYQVYAYKIRQNNQLLMELHDQRVFSSQCTAVEFIVASKDLLIAIPSKQQQLIRIWNRESLQLLHAYVGHELQISAVIFLQDGLHIASCSFDTTVRIWDINPKDDKFEYNRQKTQHKGKFPLLALTEVVENTLAFAGDDCYITIWNWIQNQVRYKCYAHLGSVMSLQSCNNYLYSVGGDSKIKAWIMQKFDSTKKYLAKSKQFKKKIQQEIFTIKISDHQVLSIDSKGHTYLMNGNLQVGASKLKIKYTETIRSIKIWKNRLFVVLREEEKSQLKQILVDLDELRINARIKQPLPGLNSLKSLENNDLRLSWRKLGLFDRKSGHGILHDLNGYFQSGDFVSIMGASGSGKSSLLSILSCRINQKSPKLRIEGDFLINGEIYDIKDFSRIAAYVEQDDVLFGALTVKQTFQFHAKLKLWKKSQKEQQQRCTLLLQKLNLKQCSDVLVGNSYFQKCISGGQKKRLSIGVELISNPKILIFDEPTSGLDSHNALIIIRQLAKLAKQQSKIILTTIHQPSTLMFQQMDKLYLLKEGMCVYNGQASKLTQYMQQTLGIPIDQRMNPADFVMFEISAFKENQGYKSPLNYQNCQKYTDFPPKFFELQSEKHKQKRQGTPSAPFSKQYLPLLERGFKSLYRTPSNQLNKLVIAFLIPAFLGILYKNIAYQIPQTFDQTFLFNFFCYLFMAHFFIFSMNTYQTVLIFPSEKQLILKQTQSNLYSITSYYIAKISTQIFGCLVPAVISGILIYLAGDLNLSSSHFGLYVAVFILLALIGFFFGLMYGVLFSNSEKAITFMPIAIMPILIFGGLVVNIHDIPVYARWLQYLSPIRHSFQIIFQDQISSPQFAAYQGLNLAEKYGLNGDTNIAFVCLFSILGGLIILSLILLKMAKRSL